MSVLAKFAAAAPTTFRLSAVGDPMRRSITQDLERARQDIFGSAVCAALDEIGDSSTLHVLLGAFCGYQRFEDWQRQHSMSRSVLSDRLAKLVANGCFERVALPDSPAHLGYALSAKGSALFSWALAVWRWEHAWIHPERGHPLKIMHETCGAVIEPELVCSACHSKVTGGDVSFTRSSGFDGSRAAAPHPVRRSIVSSGRGGPDYVGRLVDLVGDRWSFLILAAGLLGVSRFSDFDACLSIAPNILSDRLRRLVESGVFSKSAYLVKPKRYEYRLTRKGQDLYSVLVTMGQWADVWLLAPGGNPHNRSHTTCGAPLHVIPECPACGGNLLRDEINYVRVSEEHSPAASSPVTEEGATA